MASRRPRRPNPPDRRLVGYARVSTDDQTLALQVEALRALGVTPRRTFSDEGVSGSAVTRPGLDAALAALREGDVLAVYRLDRLSRSLSHLLHVLDDLRARGVGFVSIAEGIETESPAGRMMMQMLGAFAEYERALITERVRAGIASARRRGVLLGRRSSLTPVQQQEAIDMLDRGRTAADVARVLGVSDSTVCRLAQRHERQLRRGRPTTT